MASTDYPVTSAAWADCGAADDCALQIPGGSSAVIFTTAASNPGVGVTAGLRLSTDLGDERGATIQKAGLKLWVRSLGRALSVTVER